MALIFCAVVAFVAVIAETAVVALWLNARRG